MMDAEVDSLKKDKSLSEKEFGRMRNAIDPHQEGRASDQSGPRACAEQPSEDGPCRVVRGGEGDGVDVSRENRPGHGVGALSEIERKKTGNVKDF